MFNRKKTETPVVTEPVKTVGKGRPTPTRKEAEAARKQRAKTGIDSKGRARQQRLASNSQVREAMRTGDDRYLPARDQGPVKRFVRDFVDSRISILEFMIPLALIMIILGFSRNQSVRNAASILEELILVILVVEGSWVAFRLRGAIRKEFPDVQARGVTFYALMRAVNMRFLRMPKTQVGPGGKPINRK